MIVVFFFLQRRFKNFPPVRMTGVCSFCGKEIVVYVLSRVVTCVLEMDCMICSFVKFLRVSSSR